MSDGSPENRHYSVTDIFLDGAAVSSYLLGHQVKISHQDGAHIFGVQFIRQGCRASNIGKHDSDDTSFLRRRESDFAAIL